MPGPMFGATRHKVRVLPPREDLVRAIEHALLPASLFELVRDDRPDVALVDLDLDEHEARASLRTLPTDPPVPLLVLGDVRKLGPEPILAALAEGGIEYLDTSHLDDPLHFDALAREMSERLLTCSGARVTRRPPTKARRNESAVVPEPRRIVAIGVSTGGPSALQKVIPQLPADLRAPVLIVQHLASPFTGSLADSLGASSALPVREAKDGDRLEAGVVLVTPGASHLEIDPRGRVRLRPAGNDSRYVPSIDLTFLSLARNVGTDAVAVLLTGMGKDGVLGMRQVRISGGHTIAQDEATSVVFGMPKAAIEMGLVDRVVPIEDVAREIVRGLVRRR